MKIKIHRLLLLIIWKTGLPGKFGWFEIIFTSALQICIKEKRKLNDQFPYCIFLGGRPDFPTILRQSGQVSRPVRGFLLKANEEAKDQLPQCFFSGGRPDFPTILRQSGQASRPVGNFELNIKKEAK